MKLHSMVSFSTIFYKMKARPLLGLPIYQEYLFMVAKRNYFDRVFSSINQNDTIKNMCMYHGGECSMRLMEWIKRKPTKTQIRFVDLL